MNNDRNTKSINLEQSGRKRFDAFGKHWCFLLVLLLFQFPVPAGLCRADIYNPKPLEDDLVLPMPGGASMVFRPVYMGEGEALLSQRWFIIGDPAGGFPEHPTSAVLGGAFLRSRSGKSPQNDWLIYVGKYEVTEAQYYSLMPLPDKAGSDLKESQFPVANISWFEANRFIDLYNQWLFANALSKIPCQGGAVGFVRLPSEVEWEFAVRGGIEVNDDDFDRKQPYQGDVTARFEWFAGPGSSHNKKKKIGLLQPNALKIHDMLGNVSEMTHGLYKIGPAMGRMGGFACRGGHFLTPENQLRSSYRLEEPFYIGNPKKGVKPNRKPTMGFRLVLSTVIFTDFNSRGELKTAWESFRGNIQTDLTEPAFNHLAKLKMSLDQSMLGDEVRRQIDMLENALGDIKAIKKKADEDSAFSWTRIASFQGFLIYSQFPKLVLADKLIRIGDKDRRELYIRKKDEILKNIEQMLSAYSVSLRQLEQIDRNLVKQAFINTREYLTGLGAREQIRILPVVQKHAELYFKTKRADPDNWSTEFKTLSE